MQLILFRRLLRVYLRSQIYLHKYEGNGSQFQQRPLACWEANFLIFHLIERYIYLVYAFRSSFPIAFSMNLPFTNFYLPIPVHYCTCKAWLKNRESNTFIYVTCAEVNCTIHHVFKYKVVTYLYLDGTGSYWSPKFLLVLQSFTSMSPRLSCSGGHLK